MQGKIFSKYLSLLKVCCTPFMISELKFYMAMSYYISICMYRGDIGRFLYFAFNGTLVFMQKKFPFSFSDLPMYINKIMSAKDLSAWNALFLHTD